MTKSDRPSSAGPVHAYASDFWWAYVANVALMVAVSVLFRYSDFVMQLGGTEFILGAIVGAGAIGSLLMRLTLGSGVDRLGPRLIWLLGLLGVIAAVLGHLFVTTPYGPLVFCLRILFHTCLAASFAASITYVSLRAPVERMAEMIGMLGSSGFVGMAIGGELGDSLCRHGPHSRQQVDQLFVAAAIAGAVSLVFAALATRRSARPLPRRRVAVVSLLRRYHPGWLLAMAAAMGVGIGLPGTFLRPFTASRGITDIGTFFTSYAVTAFVVRLTTRRACAVWGIRATAMTGMVFLGTSLLLYLPVGTERQLMIPGIVAGIAHALLFPAIVAGGSQCFPDRYRGLGVALMLGMFDLGNLIGMPLAGGLIDAAEQLGLPPYPLMLSVVVLLLVVATSAFALGSRTRSLPRRGGRTAAITPASLRAYKPLPGDGERTLAKSLVDLHESER